MCILHIFADLGKGMGINMNRVNELFEEFKRLNWSNEYSIAKLKEDLGNKIDKICLYGAGSAGIAFLKFLRDVDIEPRYFVDKNEKRWGELCEGVEIIAPQQIIPLVGLDALVIVTINTDGKRYCKSFDEALRIGGHQGVHQMLRECGVKYDIDYTYFRRCYKLFHDDPYNLPSCSDVYMMMNHIPEITQVYDWLEDDLSKEIYYKILKFRLLDDSIEIPTSVQDKQYFEYDFFHKIADECFVDCGAFNGISLKTFLHENNTRFEAYYGFEPEQSNYEKLQMYVDALPTEIRNKIFTFPIAVMDKKGVGTLYSLNGPGSFMADIGEKKVNTNTLDTLLGDKKITFIKMNIEGSELAALHGAEEIIRTQRPRLAIAGYHKTWDLWEIPLLLKKYNPDYKLRLRSYMNHISFVYYLY